MGGCLLNITQGNRVELALDWGLPTPVATPSFAPLANELAVIQHQPRLPFLPPPTLGGQGQSPDCSPGEGWQSLGLGLPIFAWPGLGCPLSAHTQACQLPLRLRLPAFRSGDTPWAFPLDRCSTGQELGTNQNPEAAWPSSRNEGLSPQMTRTDSQREP